MKLLESKIKVLETDIFQKGTIGTHQELLLLRSQYNELSASLATANLLRLKQSYYDQGEKPGKLLAWQIKKLQSERAITIIEDDTGNTIYPLEINRAFKYYYESLYSSECPLNSEAQTDFLDGIDIPHISETLTAQLDSGLTLEEILGAIESMKTGKAAGPDGIPT